MPAAPEILDARGDVRPAEVLGKTESEHASETDRHVGVAGKVEVDLQRIADKAKPRVPDRELCERHRENPIGRPGDDVRDQHLLGKTDDKPPDPVRQVVDRDPSAGELIGDVAVADDRAGDQLRKQQQIQRGVDGTLLRRCIPAVDVHDVRDGVEGEKRDADGQQEPRHDERLRMEREKQRVDVVGEKVGVLEDAEDDQVGRDRESEPGSGAAHGHGDCHPVVEGDRREHQPGERAAALRVEDHAGDEQQPVGILTMNRGGRACPARHCACAARRRPCPARRQSRCGRREVQREQERQKQKQERRFGEQHVAERPPMVSRSR